MEGLTPYCERMEINMTTTTVKKTNGTLGERLFQNDLAITKETIRWSALENFIGSFLYTEIGQRRDGTPTTLLEEINTLGKWIAKTEVVTINYFHGRQAMSMAEISTEERVHIAENTYKLAVNKILWLNTVCKNFVGDYFIIDKIDKTNVCEVRTLVDSFAFAIQNPEAMAEA